VRDLLSFPTYLDVRENKCFRMANTQD
jgi:hypothetical protein